jgi:hypothetical protein
MQPFEDEILLRWQNAKVRFDGMQLFGLDLQPVWKEYIEAREALTAVHDETVAALAKIANRPPYLPDDEFTIEAYERAKVRRAESMQAEEKLLEISIRIKDLRPDVLKRIH